MRAGSLVLLAGLALQLAAPGVATAGEIEWTQLGPYLRPVNAIAIDPQAPDHLWVGTWGGVYRSFDGGASWEPANAGLEGVGSGRLVADPQASGTAYLISDGALYRTADGGDSWQRVTLPASATGRSGVEALAATPWATYAIAALTDCGSQLLRSTDAGASWSDITAALPEVPCPPPLPALTCAPPCRAAPRELAATQTSPDVLYVLTSRQELFRSHDRGATWEDVPSSLSWLRDLAVHPADGSLLVAVGWGDQEGEQLVRSEDGGASWRPASPTFSCYERPVFALDPREPARIYLALVPGSCGVSATRRDELQSPFPPGWGTISRSDDGGQSWAALGAGLQWFAARSLAVDPGRADGLWAGTARGVFHSVDAAQSWTAASAGIPESFPVGVWSALLDPTREGVIYAHLDGMGFWKTEDGGAHWRPINEGNPRFGATALTVQPAPPGILLASAGEAGIIRSTDGGERWHVIGGELGPWFVSGFSFDSLSPATVYAASQNASAVYKSTDGGATWLPASAGLPSASGVYDVVTDPCQSGTVYATGSGGGVFRTSDGGASWSQVGDRLPSPIGGLTASPACPTTLVGSSWSQGLMASSDGGLTWGRLGASEDADVNAFAFDPAAPARLLAATSRGLANFLPGYNCLALIDAEIFTSWLTFDPHRPGRLLVSGPGGILASTALPGVPLQLCSARLINGWVGVPLTARIGACGGRPPYTFHDSGGALPSLGLSLAPDGAVTGTPAGPAQVHVPLQAADAAGDEAEADHTFRLMELIRASAAASATVGDPPLTIQLIASATGGLGAEALQYSWNFGDGEWGSERVAVHTYWNAGIFTAVVTVSDGVSPSVRASVTIYVGVSPCELSCTATVPPLGPPGGPVSFVATAQASSCRGAPLFAWSFGDGSGAFGANMIHTYADAGTYRWALEVSVERRKCTRDGLITIESECTRGCSARTPAATVVNQPAQFAATAPAAACGAPSFRWAFGDSGQSAEPSPTHAYAVPGSYAWRVDVGSAGGTCTRTGGIWVTGTVSATGGSCAGPYSLFVPAAAHTPGLGGTSWQSDVDLLNYALPPATVDLALLRANEANNSPAVATVIVPAGCDLRIEDVLGSLLPARNAALGVRFCSGSALVNSRLYATTCGGGTCAMLVPAVGDALAVTDIRPGLLHHLSYSPDPRAGYRVNVGFASASASPAVADVHLFGDASELLGSLTQALQPFEHRQITRAHALVGAPAVQAGWAIVEVKTPGAKVFAYAMLIDNASGSGVFMLAEPPAP